MNKKQLIKLALSELGRKGGSAKSAAKTKANKRNALTRWRKVRSKKS